MDGRVKVIMKINRKLNLKKRNDAFVSHYRLLGLSKGECRTNVIRSAAQSKSVALSFRGNVDDHVQQTVNDGHRAEIAVATYRLLDPRERTEVYERVQLCYPIDRDELEPEVVSSTKLIDQMPKVTPKVQRPVSSTSVSVKLMDQPLIDEAIEGNSPSDEEPGARRRSDTLIQTDSDLTLEERRSVVRLMRQSEEPTARTLSPLGWLRSRLGI